MYQQEQAQDWLLVSLGKWADTRALATLGANPKQTGKGSQRADGHPPSLSAESRYLF